MRLYGLQTGLADRNAGRFLTASASALPSGRWRSFFRACSPSLLGCNSLSPESCQNTFGNFQLIVMITGLGRSVIYATLPPRARFAPDSPLEEAGFEPPRSPVGRMYAYTEIAAHREQRGAADRRENDGKCRLAPLRDQRC
jgi:hypothetical protein